MAQSLRGSVRQKRTRGEGAEEEEGVGIKSESYPRSPIYTAGRWSWVWWECSTTPTVSAEDRHMVARCGVVVPVTVPLGQLWE
jgi:hypothetical protein